MAKSSGNPRKPLHIAHHGRHEPPHHPTDPIATAGHRLDVKLGPSTPRLCKPVEKTTTGCPSTAITDVSSVLSGDRLVVSVAEAGRLLGVSRAFAYELAARGELPTIRLGRRILVPKAALLAMVGLSSLQS
jgi:excisionase family DNA binding protein